MHTGIRRSPSSPHKLQAGVEVIEKVDGSTDLEREIERERGGILHFPDVRVWSEKK